MRIPRPKKNCQCGRCQLYAIGVVLASKTEQTGIQEYAVAAAKIVEARYWMQAAHELEGLEDNERHRQTAELN